MPLLLTFMSAVSVSISGADGIILVRSKIWPAAARQK
jgi:hypothetical protein